MDFWWAHNKDFCEKYELNAFFRAFFLKKTDYIYGVVRKT
jgi:hypothetical protein